MEAIEYTRKTNEKKRFYGINRKKLHKRIPIIKKNNGTVQLFVSRNSFFFARLCRCDYNVVWYFFGVCLCFEGTQHIYRSSVAGSLCVHWDGTVITTHHRTLTRLGCDNCRSVWWSPRRRFRHPSYWATARSRRDWSTGSVCGMVMEMSIFAHLFPCFIFISPYDEHLSGDFCGSDLDCSRNLCHPTTKNKCRCDRAWSPSPKDRDSEITCEEHTGRIDDISKRSRFYKKMHEKSMYRPAFWSCIPCPPLDRRGCARKQNILILGTR